MATTAEDYVSFETAKLLKEKGFNEKVICYYDDGGSLNLNKFAEFQCCNQGYGSSVFAAPTLQMAIKWLRKKHQIFIRSNTSFLYPIKWYSEIFCYGDNLQTQQDIKTEYYDSPEEACEAAIKYCLEKII